MAVKDLYIGYFQSRLRLYVERAYACSERQMWLLCCRRIAKKQGVPIRMVFDKFHDPESYKITKEVEFQEVEECNNL